MPRLMLSKISFSILNKIKHRSNVLHWIRIEESFRMIKKSSKSTDGKLFKINLTNISPLIKLQCQVHFLVKLMFWSQLFTSWACNGPCHAGTRILSRHPRAMVSGGWQPLFREKMFRLFRLPRRRERLTLIASKTNSTAISRVKPPLTPIKVLPYDASMTFLQPFFILQPLS